MGRNGEVLLRFGSVVKTVNYFVDEYARVLDDKGRIVLPTKVREKLGDTVFITRAPADKCLYMYTEEEWGKLAEKLEITPANLSILKTGKAKAIRFSTLNKICDVLDCQPGDILEYERGSDDD